jgi:predicted enzyme related to lactoylglutathione lyase
MHKSRLSTFIIDCRSDDVDKAAAFWAAALGRPVEPADPGDEKYRALRSATTEPIVMVQIVDHPGRIHLDIEADDIEAEVARLEALGAKRVEKFPRWIVLEAPTGQRFCVVNPQRGPLGDDATTWR